MMACSISGSLRRSSNLRFAGEVLMFLLTTLPPMYNDRTLGLRRSLAMPYNHFWPALWCAIKIKLWPYSFNVFFDDLRDRCVNPTGTRFSLHDIGNGRRRYTKFPGNSRLVYPGAIKSIVYLLRRPSGWFMGCRCLVHFFYSPCRAICFYFLDCLIHHQNEQIK